VAIAILLNEWGVLNSALYIPNSQLKKTVNISAMVASGFCAWVTARNEVATVLVELS
jgi:hypothetical protein